MICRGSSRIVLLLGPWAFKLPTYTEWRLFLRGLLANMQERQLWRFLQDDSALCPVVFALPGGWLIVMPRVEPLTNEEFLSLPIEDFLDRDHWVIPAETKADSFGWWEGRLVAVDYGN